MLCLKRKLSARIPQNIPSEMRHKPSCFIYHLIHGPFLKFYNCNDMDSIRDRL